MRRTGPKVPESGIGKSGQPSPSHPVKGRLLPIQSILTPGHWTAKKMTMAESAMAAEKAVVVMLRAHEHAKTEKAKRRTSCIYSTMRDSVS
jgi:hypothetical protein